MAITDDIEEMPEESPYAVPQVDEDGVLLSQEGEDIVVAFDGNAYERNYEPGGHDENLAEQMDSGDRMALGQDLVQDVKQDEESRAEWHRTLVNGLEIIGLKEVPEDKVAFNGAAQINHPALAEAMVRFQANAIEELFPATGPVKTTIIGKVDDERQAQADRVEEFLNHYLTDEDDEYFNQTDMMLMYLPFAGSAFKKIYYDHVEGMTVSRYLKAEDLIVPYDATSLKTAPRYTHRYTLTRNEMRAKMESGEFIHSNNIDPDGSDPEENTAKELENISDKRETVRAEDDVQYTFYEVHKEHVFENYDWDKYEGKEGYEVALPYVVTVEEQSGEIVAIRRLWSPNDKKRRKRIHFVHYKFLPGLGFYGWGYLHVIGSLGRAASGAMRALLDGSTTASLQGGFKSKEAKIAGDFIFTPGTWHDVDMTAEDLAKSFYTPPFKEPSIALFNTLELLLTGIRSFTDTSEAMTGSADNTGPVGTTLALIEQGSKVYSGIHKRMHNAARQEFKLISLLNYEHMTDDEYPYEVRGGDRSVMKSDFDGRVDIIPVSDPNIHSSVHRMALAQAGLELVNASPDIYGIEQKKIAHRRMLEAMKYPNIDELLPDKQVKRFDPVTENQMILTGGAVKAFPEQDHQSHIAVHQMFIQEMQGSGLDPQVLEAAFMSMQAHLAEHHAHGYRLRIQQAIQAELPDVDISNPDEEEDMPIEIDNAVARAVAQNVAPPPPAQGPEDEEAQREAEHQQKMRHKQEEHDLNMKIKEEEAGLEIDSKREKSEQELRSKQVGSIIDQATQIDEATAE